MKDSNTATVLILALLMSGFITASVLPAQAMESCGMDQCCCSPFGGYCKGSEWGWYGARKPVHSPDEAAKMIRKVFLPENISVANLRDRGAFYEAEVRDSRNAVRDLVIVDKKSGRIRSIY